MATRDGGQTLLEMMVALAVITLLALLLTESVSIVSRTHQRSLDRDAADADARIRLRLARETLQSILPIERPSADRSERNAGRMVAFTGDAGSMAFIAPTPTAAAAIGGPAPSLARVEIRASKTRGGLAMRRAPFIASSDLAEADLSIEASAPTPRTIAVADSVDFAYFGVRDGSDAPGWETTWRNQSALPELIRIVLHRSGQEEVRLDVAPRASRMTRRSVDISGRLTR